jgi:murein DD-endopeptidase MepM/ murein hydrolase activator NlpD
MSKTLSLGRYQLQLGLSLVFPKRTGRPKKDFLYRLRYFSFHLRRVATDNRFAGNRFSRVLRRIFERRLPRHLVGINLAVATVFIGLTLPTTSLNPFDSHPNPRLTARLTELTTKKTILKPLSNLDPSQGYTFFHRGLDLRTPPNSPVNPVMSGTVKLAQNDTAGYGRHVIISHGNGFNSLYAHLNQINVQEGDSVDHETVIGLSGSTGHSSGPHLHLEIRENDQPFNPLILLK